MENNLGDTISFLWRTPSALNAPLRDLPEAWMHRDEGEGSWSVFEVIGHLVHTESADWIPRVKIILQAGDSQTFPPVDRQGFAQKIQVRTLGELLDEFTRLRAANLEEMRSLDLRREDLGRRGRHPVFGIVTLSELLATWATHDLTHLHQISRIMAHQYRADVGPFRKFLGVLHCDGHSSPA